MADIEIKVDELTEVISHAKEAEAKMSDALSKADKLVSNSSASNQTWTGESKNQFEMYLSLIKQYHEDLANCIEDYKSAVSNLQKDIDSYDSTEMSEIRGI